jgi:hypothetical protein
MNGTIDFEAGINPDLTIPGTAITRVANITLTSLDIPRAGSSKASSTVYLSPFFGAGRGGAGTTKKSGRSGVAVRTESGTDHSGFPK